MSSNPITDILLPLHHEDCDWLLTRRSPLGALKCDCNVAPAQQALYEAVKGCVPEVPKGMDLAAFKRVVKSGGLHPNSTKYQSYKSEATMVEIAKAYRNETLTNLSLLFGVEDE